MNIIKFTFYSIEVSEKEEERERKINAMTGNRKETTATVKGYTCLTGFKRSFIHICILGFFFYFAPLFYLNSNFSVRRF